MRRPGIDIAGIILQTAAIKSPGMLRSTRQHRKLQDENRRGRGSDGQQRLRQPDSKYFACHEFSPLNESI
jgi:hypothetical protein